MEKIIKYLDYREIKSAHRLMYLIIFTIGILNYFFGEKVLAGGGFGWDGVRYGYMAQYFYEAIQNGQLSHYYAQRILPSAIVHLILSIFGIANTNANVINIFELYNLTLLMCGCWVWKLVANTLSLSILGRWIGFSGLFLNFESSKQAFYNPVLTDVTALLIALLLLFLYLQKGAIRLFFVTVIGSFCWPVVSISGALLLLYLNSKLSPESIKSPLQHAALEKLTPKLLWGAIFFSMTALLAFLCLLSLQPLSTHACLSFEAIFSDFLKRLLIDVSLYLGWMANNNYLCALENVLIKISRLLTSLPSIYISSVAIFILIGSKYCIKESISNALKADRYLIMLSLGAVLLPAFLVNLISNQNIPSESSLGLLVKISLLPQEGKILLPLVTLTSFWGPIILLLLFNWRVFCVKVRWMGSGVLGVIVISIILSLANEPRFLTIGWPFMVLAGVMFLEDIDISNSFKYVFITLTILYAQFWIKLNYAPWLPPDGEGLFEYPKQLYYMHYGLWMAWDSYVIQFIIFTISGILLNYLLKRNMVGKV